MSSDFNITNIILSTQFEYICHVSSVLSECKNGRYKVINLGNCCNWLSRQGLVLGATISVLQNNKNYVLFRLDGNSCAIDFLSACDIIVERL